MMRDVDGRAFRVEVLSKASNIADVMLRERPGEAVKGALGLPKARMFDRIALTDRLLQPATSAIWSAVSCPARSIAWICSRCATARLGAMMVGAEIRSRWA
jgi:hypothetical protein